MLNSFADHIDLKKVLDSHVGGGNLHQSAQEIEEETVNDGHCSVLVKVRCFDFPLT